MRKAFSLIELLIASAISVVLFSSLFFMFGSIWYLMRESGDELQLMIHARAVRERMLYRLDGDHDGLFNASTKITGITKAVGFNANIPKIEREVDGDVVTEVKAVPADFEFLKQAAPTTQNFAEEVYWNQFMPDGYVRVDKDRYLLRINLSHASSSKGMTLEDHPIIYVCGGIKW